MEGERAALLGDALLDDNMVLTASDENAIIVFAHLLYLHKKAFEHGTGYKDERDEREHRTDEPIEEHRALCAFQVKSRSRQTVTEPGEDRRQDGQEKAIEQVREWIGRLSQETTSPWESLHILSDVWSWLTIPAVCGMIDVLGPFAYPFLHSLAVKIPRYLLKQRCLQREKIWQQCKSFPGKFKKGERGPVCDYLDFVAPATDPERTFMEIVTSCRNKVEVEVHYSELRDIVQYPSVEGGDPRRQLTLAVKLLDADASTCLFATPVGQALAGNCWDVAFPNFVRHKVMEALALFVLVFLIGGVSHEMQEDEDWPPRWKITANLCFASYSALCIVLEAIMAFTNEDLWHAYLNTNNALAMFVELMSVFFVSMACHDYWIMQRRMEWTDTFLYQHPMAFGVLIFMKWIQLMIGMINFNGLASTLLPAWCAIKSPESVVFLLYLFLLCLGSCFAYYALPLELGTFPASYFEAFFRMIRLCFLGDFEMSELEGLERHINNKTWEIEDSSGVSEIQNSLKAYVIVLGLFFPVIGLNVYVGLLSEEYKKAKDNQVHLIASFRTATVFRLHLHRLFLLKCWCCPVFMSLDCFRRTIPRDLRKANLKEEDISKLGTWIQTPATSGTPSCMPGTHRLFLDVSNGLLSDHAD